MSNARRPLHKKLLLLSSSLMCLVIANGSCSVPSLETAGCVDARESVKRFYSIHFGNDMHPSLEGLEMRKSFLTPELIRELSGSIPGTATDYFTATDDPPKAFRVGGCTLTTPETADLQIVLLWRSDTTSRQSEVHVTAIKSGEAWLINKVSR